MGTTWKRYLDGDNGRPILVAGVLGLGGGVVAAMLLAATASKGPYWSDGFALVVYMSAAVALSGLLGLIFAVPRARTDAAPPSAGRYSTNSNLEQISDWLTKLLVGAGLVQLGALPGGLASLGDFLGAGSKIPNGEAVTVMLVLYGSGIGFLFVYLWVRLRLRVLLEASEQQAEDQWRTEEVAASLTEATDSSEVEESQQKIERVARRATTAVAGRSAADLKAVLWVDDHPENNARLVEALGNLGIAVDEVVSTAEALQRFSARTHAVVITDLGRTEDGAERNMAGLELIKALRERGETCPIVVYAGSRGVQLRSELIRAGAQLVTNRPTEVFDRTVRLITGTAP